MARDELLNEVIRVNSEARSLAVIAGKLLEGHKRGMYAIPKKSKDKEFLHSLKTKIETITMNLQQFIHDSYYTE